MPKSITWYFVSDENDEQMSMPTTSYKEAKADLKYYQAYGSGYHTYKIESYLEEVSSDDR